VAIRVEMFLRHFVAWILNQFFCDVPRHVCVAVCLSPTTASQLQSQAVKSTAKNKALLRIIRLRQRSSGFDVLHPGTTSTRIPLLSP